MLEAGMILAALIGPIAGVAMGNAFARHQSKKAEASQLFRQIANDVQRYRNALLMLYRHDSSLLSPPDSSGWFRE